MKINFNVTGSERKALVMAMGSLLALVLLMFLPVKDPDPKEWGQAD